MRHEIPPADTDIELIGPRWSSSSSGKSSEGNKVQAGEEDFSEVIAHSRDDSKSFCDSRLTEGDDGAAMAYRSGANGNDVAPAAGEQSPLLAATSGSEGVADALDRNRYDANNTANGFDDSERHNDDFRIQHLQSTGRERAVTYLCFLVLGASVLLPWNLLIVVTPYFNYRLSSSSSSTTSADLNIGDDVTSPSTSTFASSFVPLIFTVSNFILIVRATYSQQKKGFENNERKLFGSIGVMTGIIALLAVTTAIDVPHWIFFVLLLFVSIAGAAVSATIQSGSAALTTLFEDAFYMQGVMSGQGAIGFAVSITQFLAALRSSKHTSSPSSSSTAAMLMTSDEDGQKLVSSTGNFFIVSLVFAAISGYAAYTLVKLPLYKQAMKRHREIERLSAGGSLDDGSAFPSNFQHHKSSIYDVNRKIQSLGLAVMYIFVVTIGLFPSITSSIKAVSQESAVSSDLLWIPLGFVVFNTADWVGRALPGFHQLVFTDKRSLLAATALRTLFIPIMLLCNVQVSNGNRTPLIASDTLYLLILFLFAISSGYLTSLIMMRAIMDETLEPEEVDVASSIMLIYLTAGLSLGAILSFLLQAIAR